MKFSKKKKMYIYILDKIKNYIKNYIIIKAKLNIIMNNKEEIT